MPDLLRNTLFLVPLRDIPLFAKFIPKMSEIAGPGRPRAASAAKCQE
jgi:hypothetical protein